MKKLLLIALLLPLFARAQIIYPDGGSLTVYTATFTFTAGDLLTRNSGLNYPDTTIVLIDTSSCTLWQIGNTLKPVFSNDTLPVSGIMTDTLNPYPPNANDFFVMQINLWQNTIVDIWHKYDTDSLHAGGVVEFSTDSGSTWMNIVDCPNIHTVNFYTSADTINSGLPAFSGHSNGEQLSRFQFINCIATMDESTPCPGMFFSGDFLVRFRFVSDSTIDSLSGWIIDSIELEYPGCGEGVNNVANQNTLSIFPNPATSQLTIQSTNEPLNNITITNILGQTVYTKQNINSQQLTADCSLFPGGVYFVKVNGSEVRKFVKE